jgi:hypothetical protein
MRRFENDWATEEIAKQYLKNKRKSAVRQGLIKVPERYAYLKENSAKRSASGSRKSKAREELEKTQAKKDKKRGKAKKAKKAEKAQVDGEAEETADDMVVEN